MSIADEFGTTDTGSISDQPLVKFRGMSTDRIPKTPNLGDEIEFKVRGTCVARTLERTADGDRLVVSVRADKVAEISLGYDDDGDTAPLFPLGGDDEDYDDGEDDGL